MLKHLYLFFFMLIFPRMIDAQEVYFVEGDSKIKIDFISWNLDSLSHKMGREYSYRLLVEEGYWDLKLDSLKLDAGVWGIYGQMGGQYYFQKLEINPEVLGFFNKKKSYFDRIVLKDRRRFILNYYKDRGYPFARVYYDSLQIENYKAQAFIGVERNGIQSIDSLVIKSNSKFSSKVLNQMIHFKKGQLYSASDLWEIEDILNQYSFLQSTTKPRILFTPDKNVLYIYLEEKSAHYFDGLLGFASDEQGEVTFRGKLEFKLENAFHRGEKIYLKWDAQGEIYQRLSTNLSFPFILSSWGVEANLNIHKQDSSFVKTDYGLGLQYNWKSYWQMGFGLEKSESSVTKDHLLASDVLFSFEKTMYYANLNFQRLDRIEQSRKGISSKLELKAGIREEESREESEYFVALQLATFSPIKSNFSLKMGLNYKQIISEGLSDNNLLFLGGSQSMRGFLENQFRLSSYLTLSPSLRYHFSSNYMLELFTDQGFIYHPTDELLDNKHVWSTGIQFELPVKSGWLYLGYALGKMEDESFNFSEGVVHFGMRNIF